jgi:hypothetical protein
VGQPRDYQARDKPWQAVLRRILDMAAHDQERIYAALGDMLEGPAGEEPVHEREMRARLEGVKAMEAAAAHLGLPEGKAPTSIQYKQAARETDLPMSWPAVYKAFEKRWGIARDFYEGKQVPATASQRATRRAVLGTKRGREEPIECVRVFLNQEPPPQSTRLADYESWANEAQAKRGSDEPRLHLHADGMRMTLRTSWDRVLAVARGELTLEDAQQQRLDEVLAECGDYIGITVAGWLLGMSGPVANKYRRTTGFPPHAARVDGDTLWRRADIETYRDHTDAYRTGERKWEHEAGWLDHELIGTDHIQALTGLPRDQVRSRVYEGRWDRVPKPAGKAARRMYWLRSDVEAWECKRQEEREQDTALAT